MDISSLEKNMKNVRRYGNPGGLFVFSKLEMY